MTRIKALKMLWEKKHKNTDFKKASGGYSFCPLLMPMSEAFSISFIL